MDIKLARNMLKSAINNKKGEFEAMLKLDQALAYYDGLETKLKQMDNESLTLTTSVENKRSELSALDYKLTKKTEEVQEKITKAENDGAEKLDEAHKRYGVAEREIIKAFKDKEALYEDMAEKMDSDINSKTELLAKMEKAIDKHKKDFGALANA